MLHFINCILLAYGPFIVIYRTSKLLEESALKQCAFAAVGYAATQVVEFVVMAMTPGLDAGGFHIAQEIFKTLITMCEAVGVYYTLKWTPNISKFEYSIRVLAVGIGWAFAESVALYLIPLWIGARGMQFSWEYIEMGIASNVNLVLHLAFIGAIWLWARTDVDKASKPLVLFVVAFRVLLPSVLSYLQLVQLWPSFQVLAFRGAVSLVLGLATRFSLRQYAAALANKGK